MAKKSKKKSRSVFFSIIILFTIIITINIIIKAKYPIGYRDYINKYSKEYNVDPYLIVSIINVESNFDTEAKSPKDARGLMQISPITADWAAKELGISNFTLESLYDPGTNIMIGCWYFNKLKNEYDNNLNLILAAYNGGSGNVNKWLADERYSKDGKSLEKIPFKETEEYVEKVKENYKMYKKLYGGKIRENNGVDYQFPVRMNNFKRLLKKFLQSIK